MKKKIKYRKQQCGGEKIRQKLTTYWYQHTFSLSHTILPFSSGYAPDNPQCVVLTV